jgi:MFS family permease
MRSFPPLQHRGFRDLFFGQTVSTLGDVVYYFVFLFVTDQVTRDPRLVAVVATCQAIPYVLFGPFAGVLADRFDRRKVMLWCEGLSVLTTLLICLYGLMVKDGFSIVPLCVAAFALSTMNAFFAPARSAAIPRLATGDHAAEAAGLMVSMQQVMGLISAALLATVLAALSKIFPDHFLSVGAGFNALTYLISFWFTLKLPALLPDREETGSLDRGLRDAWLSFRGDLAEGVRAVRQDPVVKIALPVSAIGTLFISGFMILYVTVNREWFGGRLETLAWIELSYAAVVVVGCLWLTKRPPRHPGQAFLFGIVGTGVLVGLMAFSRDYVIFLILNMLCGITVAYLIVPINQYIQTAVPDELRGRVSSLWGMLNSGMQPVGLALIGPMLASLRTQGTFLAMGIGMALPGILGYGSKGIRRATLPSPTPDPE